MQEGIKVKKRGLLKKLGAWFLTLVLASGVLPTGMTAQAETGSPAMNEPAGGAADIVLVLDVSGSMDDPFGSEDTTKRIDGLKTAVAALADEIQSINGTVGEGGEKHRVALIKFAGDKREEIGNDEYQQGQYKYNNSQIVKPLTDDMQAIKDGAGGLKSSGATRADYGLELAERYITVHSDRRQIVIFFTDGGPSSFSNYDPMVANAGVAAAKSIKDKGAEVYTIGIQSGADAGEVTEATSDSNRFLHAVSSNYPNATANDRGSLGERTGTKDYYKAATSTAGVKEAMLSVLESIGSEASPVTLALTGQKDLYEEKENELAPKELTGGEFLFRLEEDVPEITVLSEENAETAGQSMPMPAAGGTEVRNTADGSFRFGEISFTKPGTYRYKVTEANEGASGITYDLSVYHVTVNVSFFAGQLQLETGISKDGSQETIEKMVFENRYKPVEIKPVDVILEATKKLDGRKLNAGEFHFVVKDESGNVVRRAASDADGKIVFERLTFKEPGSYTYTISEEKEQLDYVIYDNTVYTCTIKVIQKDDGVLVAELDTEGKEPVFQNSYKEPVKPEETKKTEEPKKTGSSGHSGSSGNKTQTASVATGDQNPVELAASCGFLALAGLAAALGYIRKKRYE